MSARHPDPAAHRLRARAEAAELVAAASAHEKLPDRREADGDRRAYPFAGYGAGAARDPENRRVGQRRWWGNRKRGRPQPSGEVPR